ncbi:homoserine dehydrogenase [Lutispora thermophila]|uniref:Homoserine dehydrogenase n=1 Tax=Lutispora thermophila DSM 19022 TaxID=1122184 RepID=A0A1M6AY16_9FIRM|nr:homoserine dehydrogenase [Lutispora thermophila DSM 19022]
MEERPEKDSTIIANRSKRLKPPGAVIRSWWLYLKEGAMMNIALIGCGGVGKAFINLLQEREKELETQGIDISLKYIIGSKGGIYDPQGINKEDFIKYAASEEDITKYPEGGSRKLSIDNIIENKDVDILIELTPTSRDTGEPGMTHITKALSSGISVVTGNKGPIMLAYGKLKSLAKDNGVQLAIGCTTGGALPSINAGVFDLAGSSILSIEGVLNGTTNYIIQEMEAKSISFEEALKKAQESGIAEADPSLDIEGWDTAMKMLILVNVLMGEDKTLNDIKVSGIKEITLKDIERAKAKGKKLKLVGKAVKEKEKLVMSVDLEEISVDHPLYGVDGKNKGVRYVSDTLGDLTISGGASGTKAAAASVLRDIVNIHKGYRFV